MRLNTSTDYALRILIYCGRYPDRLCTSQEISQAFNITPANTSKIVNSLAKKGYIESQRGRYGGGIRLGRKAEDIKIGDFVRDVEPDLEIVQCFNPEKNTCPVISHCALASLLHDGLNAMLLKLNEKSLADIL